MADTKINIKYKDRLFRLRFGSEEYKEDILSLYNALNDSSYCNADDLTITTIDDVIYIKMKNDVSILLDGNMPLWEQQGSINPNMPVRGFMYFGNLYSQYVKVNKLKLSDSFMNKTDNGEFEWTATVYNLNRGEK